MNRLFNIVLMSSQLFDEDYSVGQMGLIEGLKNNAGVIVCWVISAVGFLIVAAAIIKNALAGLYLAFPKLWDKVYAVKQRAEQSAQNMAGGEKGKKFVGSFLMIFLSILPDVKSATEFGEDEEGGQSGSVDTFKKKEWLTKAIPEFIGLVMIGMLIFYGYPTKLANWVGETGRFALDAFFDNVDPVQLTKKVFDGISTYELSTDNASSSFEQNVNAMTRSAMKQMYTKYSDMHQQPLQQTATALEADLLHKFSEETTLQSLLSSQDGMTISFAVQLTATRPVINTTTFDKAEADGETIDNMWVASSTSGVKQYKYFIKTSEFPTGSTKVGDADYILITVNATPKSQTVVSSSKATFVVNSETAKVDTNKCVLYIPSVVAMNTTSDTGLYTTNGASVTIYLYASNGKVLETYNGSLVVDGRNGAVSLTNSKASDLSRKIANASYMEILLPTTSYTLYESITNNTAITTKVTVYAIRIKCSNGAGGSDGWINTTWSDYTETSVTTSDKLTPDFFNSKKSSEVKKTN